MWILLLRLWDCVGEECGLSILITVPYSYALVSVLVESLEEGRRHAILPVLVFCMCVIPFFCGNDWRYIRIEEAIRM